MITKQLRAAYSLLELVVIVAMIGIVAAIVVPRAQNRTDDADVAACYVYKGDIEIQAEIWNHNTGSWPTANLATIGADINYFPEGLPTCPVDSSGYTIDTTTGRVIGHNH